MWAESITAPMYAPLSDRIGRRPIIIVLTFLFGVFAVGFGLVQSVWAAVVVRACRKPRPHVARSAIDRRAWKSRPSCW